MDGTLLIDNSLPGPAATNAPPLTDEYPTYAAEAFKGPEQAGYLSSCHFDGESEVKATCRSPKMVPSMAALRARIGRQVWLASYELESARERHATARCYFRSALCSLGLAALHHFGGHA